MRAAIHRGSINCKRPRREVFKRSAARLKGGDDYETHIESL